MFRASWLIFQPCIKTIHLPVFRNIRIIKLAETTAYDPSFFMNVFIALKGTHFLFLFATIFLNINLYINYLYVMYSYLNEKNK